jgi:hypothetical protein
LPIKFEQKDERQKNDCLRTGCKHPAILEAVCKKDSTYTARVRCCANPGCKAYAANLAKQWCQEVILS